MYTSTHQSRRMRNPQRDDQLNRLPFFQKSGDNSVHSSISHTPTQFISRKIAVENPDNNIPNPVEEQDWFKQMLILYWIIFPNYARIPVWLLMPDQLSLLIPAFVFHRLNRKMEVLKVLQN